MLLPALALAQRDRARDELTPEDEQFIFQVTQAILDDLVLPQQKITLIATGAAPLPANPESPPPPPKALILGCPAQDQADELALQMLQQLLTPANCAVHIASVTMLSSEIIAWVKENQPALVCIATLPPGGMAQARYLSKRLRQQFHDLKILIGIWGLRQDGERVQERFRSAGADSVATTLLQSRSQIIPLVQVAAPSAPAQEPKPQPAATQ